MGNRNIYWLVLILMIWITPLLSAQTTAHLSGTIKELGTAKIYLSYRMNDSLYIDSAEAKQNSFILTKTFKESVLCTLSNSLNKQIRIFIAENSNIEITGKLDTFYELKITGSKEDQLYSSFREALFSLPRKPQPAGNEAAYKQTLAEYIKRDRLLRDSIVSGFVAKYPSTVASAIIIHNTYVMYPNRVKATENFRLLSPQIKSSAYGKRVKTFIDADKNTGQGAPAADFSLKDKDGKSYSLSAFRGQYVLIDFWASWCVPCRKENPNLIRAYADYKDRGFTIVGISMDSSKENWLTAVAQDQLTWLQLNDPQTTDGKVAEAYGVKSLPANFLISREGKIVGRNLRGDALEKRLRELIP